MATKKDPIRDILSEVTSFELCPHSSASMMNIEEVTIKYGVDKQLLTEDAIPLDGVEMPKGDKTHIGVHLPADREVVDVRPMYAYVEDMVVGMVQAIIMPSNQREKRGSLPNYDVVYAGQRFYSKDLTKGGLRQYFDTEKEAKEYVSGENSAKWMYPENPGPWESLSQKDRNEQAIKLAESLMEGDKFERCVKKVKKKNKEQGKPEKGSKSGKGNPWAICHASTNESEEVDETELNAKKRKSLPTSDFALPKERKYPVDTKNRARNALARVSQFGSNKEKAKVRSKVKRKYPGIEQEKDNK